MPLYCTNHATSRPAYTVYFHCSAVLTLYCQSCFWSSFWSLVLGPWSLVLGCHWRRVWGNSANVSEKGTLQQFWQKKEIATFLTFLREWLEYCYNQRGTAKTIRIVQHRKKPFDLEIFSSREVFYYHTYLGILLAILQYITYLAIFAYLQYLLIYGRYYTRSDFTNIHSC